jgi:hypothetical protein
MLRIGLILVASLLGLGPRALVCQETIIADRPGIGSGSFVVGGGTLQLEGGAEFAHSDADQYNLGQLLVRFGLPWFELGAQFNSFVVERSAEDGNDEGFQDIGLRIKGRLWSPEDVALTVSLMGTLNFPTGSTLLTEDEVVPTVTLLGDYTITDRWALGSNIAYTFGPGDLSDLVLLTLTPSLVIAPSFGLGAYAGYAGFYTSGTDLHFLEGGLALALTRGVQFDLNGGVEVDSGDYFVGLGIAARLLRR